MDLPKRLFTSVSLPACVMAIAIGLFAATNACAQVVLTVNSNLDQVDDDTSDGACHTAAGTCTLRAAVMQANHIGGVGATIMVPAGTYLLHVPTDADGDDSGDLNLTAPFDTASVITIIGANASTTIIDAQNLDRVFSIAATRIAVISGVTVRHGKATASGGGIYNAGNLTLNDVVVSDNSASQFGTGGGIYTEGRLTLTKTTIDGNTAYEGGGVGVDSNGNFVQLTDCTLNANNASQGAGLWISANSGVVITASRFTGNQSEFAGGGIYNAGGVTLDQSTLSSNSGTDGAGLYNQAGGNITANRNTLSGNRAIGGNGGGIYNSGAVLMSNDTVSTNSATGNGGGVYSSGTFIGENSTIAFNEADSDFDSVGGGAGIFNSSGAFDLYNSIVAGNVVQVDHAFEDCEGPVSSHGHNKYSDAADANMSHCSIIQIGAGNFSPMGSMNELGSLQNNGGPTKTHAIVYPSSMIDDADSSVGCGFLTTDQRGVPRVIGARCDIGAYEYEGIIFKNGFE
jgi:predicted outer membrane repeat protein